MMSQINKWVEKIRGCSYCGLFSSGLLIPQQGRIGEVYEVLNEFIQSDFCQNIEHARFHIRLFRRVQNGWGLTVLVIKTESSKNVINSRIWDAIA